MKEKVVIDIGRIMDEAFRAAEELGDAFGKSFPYGSEEWKERFSKRFKWQEGTDFYPSYSYPPANVYLSPDRSLVFEFALAGIDQGTIDLRFQGDYMVLSAKVNEELKAPEDVHYFKRRLKLKDIEGQKYFVPDDKFDREKVKATYKNGVLRVVVPPRDGVTTEDGIKVEIVTNDADAEEKGGEE